MIVLRALRRSQEKSTLLMQSIADIVGTMSAMGEKDVCEKRCV